MSKLLCLERISRFYCIRRTCISYAILVSYFDSTNFLPACIWGKFILQLYCMYIVHCTCIPYYKSGFRLQPTRLLLKERWFSLYNDHSFDDGRSELEASQHHPTFSSSKSTAWKIGASVQMVSVIWCFSAYSAQAHPSEKKVTQR